MGIIYLISVLALITAFMIFKKTEKTIDVLSFLGISIVLLFSYNMFVYYVLTFVHIPCSLLGLTLINTIIAIVLILITVKRREIQKFKLDKFGLFSIFVIFVVTFSISCVNFGIPLKIKYETTDPATHYLTSVIFSEEDELLVNYKDDAWGKFAGRKSGSYVNSGIIMKCFEGVIDEFDYFNIFIIFGMFILFLTGAMMYNTIVKFTKSVGCKWLALFVSLIYVLGYPLNGFIFGFEYMSMGILVVRNDFAFHILF